MLKNRIFLIICLVGMTNIETNSIFASSSNDSPNRNLLIVVDGLHPGYITADLMPNLYELGKQGVFGDRHSAAFPTVTRVNSPSISTGSYPARHGIIHNTMWLPEMGDDAFSTGNAGYLQQLDELTDGQLLTTVSVGELMEEAGYLFFVCGSGGSGNTLLQNHRGKGKGIWSAGSGGFFVPESAGDEASEVLGEQPEDRPAATVWSFDAYLHHALGDSPPDFTLMWINEPDAAGHGYGVGSPEAIEAVANVDKQIERILDAHEEQGLKDRINIFVTSDHGFSTNTGQFSLQLMLETAGLKLDGVKVVSNMIYLTQDNPQLLADIVETLQRHEEVGAVYTRPARSGSSEGSVSGTISTATVQWDHERSADILVSPAWNDDINEFGFAGGTTRSGTATHGSDSPYDVGIRLVAAGPDIKTGLRSKVPTGNVDFIPTILHLLGIESASEMDGRVMHELLKDGPDPETIHVHEHIHQAGVSFPDGFRYQATLETLQVGATFYLRSARTERKNEQ